MEYCHISKVQALYNAIYNGEQDDNVSLKYLEGYWSELATNPAFIEAFLHSRERIEKVLSALLNSRQIEEKDVLAFSKELHSDDLIRLMVALFPHPLCLALYSNIHKQNLILYTYEDNVTIVSAIITMTGDVDTFEKLLRKCDYIDECYGHDQDLYYGIRFGYFIGAAKNKRALNWKCEHPDLFNDLCLSFGLVYMAVAENPDILVISRELFDMFREGKDPIVYAIEFLYSIRVSVINEDYWLACYEILFRTGYFPYSFFTDEIPKIKYLEKWLSLSVDI